MKNQEVVTYAKIYSFKNDDGKLVQGGEIHILDKVKHVTSDFGKEGGHKVAKLKTSYEVATQVLAKVPALYNVEYDVSINRDNAVTLVPVAVELVKEFKLL